MKNKYLPHILLVVELSLVALIVFSPKIFADWDTYGGAYSGGGGGYEPTYDNRIDSSVYGRGGVHGDASGGSSYSGGSKSGSAKSSYPAKCSGYDKYPEYTAVTVDTSTYEVKNYETKKVIADLTWVKDHRYLYLKKSGSSEADTKYQLGQVCLATKVGNLIAGAVRLADIEAYKNKQNVSSQNTPPEGAPTIVVMRQEANAVKLYKEQTMVSEAVGDTSTNLIYIKGTTVEIGKIQNPETPEENHIIAGWGWLYPDYLNRIAAYEAEKVAAAQEAQKAQEVAPAEKPAEELAVEAPKTEEKLVEKTEPVVAKAPEEEVKKSPFIAFKNKKFLLVGKFTAYEYENDLEKLSAINVKVTSVSSVQLRKLIKGTDIRISVPAKVKVPSYEDGAKTKLKIKVDKNGEFVLVKAY